MKLTLDWSKANGKNSAGVTAVAMLAGEARPPGIAKHGATTKPELAESSFAGGLLNKAAAAASEARPPRFVKYSVTSESEPGLAQSSDEESSDEAEPGCARPSRKETVEAMMMMVSRERVQQRVPSNFGMYHFENGCCGSRRNASGEPLSCAGWLVSFGILMFELGVPVERGCPFPFLCVTLFCF